MPGPPLYLLPQPLEPVVQVQRCLTGTLPHSLDSPPLPALLSLSFHPVLHSSSQRASPTGSLGGVMRIQHTKLTTSSKMRKEVTQAPVKNPQHCGLKFFRKPAHNG